MENIHYKALVVEEHDGKFVQQIKTLSTTNLKTGNVLIRVHYSSINYKDALSASGNKGITKKYPHTPGIDAAGIVEYSESETFKVGDKVIVTGNDLGMNTPGGFGQYIRVPETWVVNLPAGLTLKEAMILGTAGFTAGVQIRKMSEIVKPDKGKIIVTGSTGGVGSVAVSILKKLGYHIVAVSGKDSEYEFLRKIGADEIISRSDFENNNEKPILTSLYAGGIDTVGGKHLEKVIKSLEPLGAVTTCGSVAGANLNLSVFPFILRGISLIGVSSQNYPLEMRKSMWYDLSTTYKPDTMMDIYTEISLEEVEDTLLNILKGKVKGRTIVNMK